MYINFLIFFENKKDFINFITFVGKILIPLIRYLAITTEFFR